METEEVKARVKKVIAHVLEINESEIADDAGFVDDLGASSLQSIRLVAGFEEEFDIEMDEDKSLQVQTVCDAVEFINTYLSQSVRGQAMSDISAGGYTGWAKLYQRQQVRFFKMRNESHVRRRLQVINYLRDQKARGTGMFS